jgi:hypothetical protein
MNVTYNVDSEAPVDDPRPTDRATVHVLRFALVPVGIILWAIGVAQTNTGDLGAYGLPAALSYAFYLGLGLLIVSIGIELARAELSEWRLGLHAAVLVWMLYGTGAVVYSEGRYAWLYKTVGVVQYVGAHGSLNRSIDIYQNWPGFFALAAWFDKVAGVSTPLDYAKWVQVVVELAALPLLYTIYRAFGLSVRQRWIGLLLYSAANWIGQDYFSPQALGTLLSLGIMALAARWLFAGNFSSGADSEANRLRMVLPAATALFFLYFVLTISHEISPYIVTIQLCALAITGTIRPRWIALATGAIAIIYLAPNFTFVNSHYGLLASIGDFFQNIEPPSASSGYSIPYPESHRIIGDCSELLSIGMWILALIGAWLRRKSLRTVIALLLLAFSPIAVLVAGAYGNEGILRVYLFSLPWSAALAASALAPLKSLTDNRNRASIPYSSRRPAALLSSFDRSTLRAPLAIAIVAAMFLVAFYGDDASNVMPSSEVTTITNVLEHAQPGPVFAAVDNAPLFDTARYNQFGEFPFLDTNPIAPGVAAELARTAAHLAPGGQAYVVVAPSMIAYSQAYSVTTQGNFNVLLSALARSPYWKLIASDEGTVIYDLTAAGIQIPTYGPYFNSAFLAVP